MRGATTFGEIRIPADGKRLRDIEREALELTLQLTDFNQSAAARILCISRPTLARKLRAYGLEKDGDGGQVEPSTRDAPRIRIRLSLQPKCLLQRTSSVRSHASFAASAL